MNQETIESAARAVADAVKISIRPGGETMRLLDKGHTFHLNPDEARTAARAVIAAIHPTVDSEEELDALPIGAIGVDKDGVGFCVDHYGACSVGYDPCVAPSPALPATVLYTPGGAA